MKGCKYCRTPHQDILTFTVGEDKDGFEIIGHIDCDGQGLRYFDDVYEGGVYERVNINFCPMCGRDMRKEDIAKITYKFTPFHRFHLPFSY